MLHRKTLIIIIFIIAHLTIIGFHSCNASTEENYDYIKVTVSIEVLKTIISPILNGVGEVYPIVSGGVEPHGFTLTPSIINDVSESDLIIITGHMEWEKKLIEEIAKVKGINASPIFIDLLKLNGIKILYIDGGRNIHGFWLFPDNALIIAKEVKERVSEIKPNLSQKISENYRRFEKRVLLLKSFLNNLSGKYGMSDKSVVIGFYAEQYIVETVGLNVGLILMGEEGSLRPETLREVYEGLKSGKYICIVASDIAIYMENVKKVLEEISEKTGCPIAYVFTVSSGGLDDYDSIMCYNAGQIYGALLSKRSSASNNLEIYPFVIAALLIVIAFEIALLVRKARSHPC